MDPSRIAELLQPYLGPDARRLTPDALEHISTYIDILQRWNARINLTAIRDEEEIVTRHFGESLFAARHLFPTRVATGAKPVLSEVEGPVPPTRSEAARVKKVVGLAEKVRSASQGMFREKDVAPPDTAHVVCNDRGRAALQGRVQAPEKDGALSPVAASDQRLGTNGGLSVVDIGSGAGFPGIPIKLWAPEISLTLIESNHKKATFLKEAVRALTLTDVHIQAARAEALSTTFDIVTLRAVERFGSILPTAAGLVCPGGSLALMIGEAQLPQAQSALPTLDWSAPLPLPNSQKRVLAIAVRR